MLIHFVLVLVTSLAGLLSLFILFYFLFICHSNFWYALDTSILSLDTIVCGEIFTIFLLLTTSSTYAFSCSIPYNNYFTNCSFTSFSFPLCYFKTVWTAIRALALVAFMKSGRLESRLMKAVIFSKKIRVVWLVSCKIKLEWWRRWLPTPCVLLWSWTSEASAA